MSKEAEDKIRKELDAYREAAHKLTGAQVYGMAPEILFTEAAADRLSFLAKDETMAALIMAGGTLKGCVASIVAYCKRDIGRSGEISEDQFRAAIRDYYRMPESAVVKNDPTQAASHGPKEPSTTPHTEAARPISAKKQLAGPTMLSTQLDLFGMMAEPGAEEEDQE